MLRRRYAAREFEQPAHALFRGRMGAQPRGFGRAPAGKSQARQPRCTRSMAMSAEASPSGSSVRATAARSASNSRTRDRPSCTSMAMCGAKMSNPTASQLTTAAPTSSSGRLTSSRSWPVSESTLVMRVRESARLMTRMSPWAMCATSCASTPVICRRSSRASSPEVRAMAASLWLPTLKALTMGVLTK